MGVVYEAVQESLDRRVAHKVLSPALLGSGRAVERFRREAETVARLHHSNIVPVFGVGEECGLHYYVMQYIDGQSLDEVIWNFRKTTIEQSPDSATRSFQREETLAVHSSSAAAAEATLPDDVGPQGDHSLTGPGQTLSARFGTADYWKTVAEIGSQVASALDYAHSSGVCHRDIKPSNLLIDDDGTVWLVDFGLARLIEDNELTQTGDLVGTLRYMSPEQVLGEFDSRSDIYSLGLTLYELLTFRPAHDASVKSRILQQNREQPPRAPRSVNSQIPADMETIVLKAMSHDPADRYRTAGELAADLRRFIDGFVIRARRAGRLELLWRWSRRNPALARTSVLTFVLLLTVAAVSTWGFVTTQNAFARLDVAYRELDSAQARAEGNLTDAMAAFEAIVERLSSRGIPHSLDLGENEDGDDLAVVQTVAVTEADAELLQELLEFYTKFSQRNDQSPQVAVSTARVQRSIGDINQRLGRFEEAVAAYGSAQQIFTELQENEPWNCRHTLDLATALNEIGVTESRRGQIRKAAQLHQLAIAELQKLKEEDRASREVRFLLAQTYNWLGSMRVRSGLELSRRPDRGVGPGFHPPGGPPGIDQGGPHPAFRPGSPGRGNTDSDLWGRGQWKPQSWREPGTAASPHDALSRAHSPLDERATAERLLLGLVAEVPAEPRYLLELAHHYRNGIRGPVLFSGERSRFQSLQKSISILENLVEQNSDNPAYVFELADTLAMSGRELNREEDPEDAILRFARSIDLAQTLHSRFPNNVEYQVLLANSLRRLSRARDQSGDVTEASRLLDQSLLHLAEISQGWPALAVYQLSYVQALRESARLCRKQRQSETAEDRLRTAIQVIQENLSEWHPPGQSFQELMQPLQHDLSRLLRAEGRQEEADRILEKARSFGYKRGRTGRGSDRQRFGERPLRSPFQKKPGDRSATSPSPVPDPDTRERTEGRNP